jgi:signal transduction histidine kinase
MLLLQAHEPARLAALARAAIFGSGREPPFEELVALARRHFATTMSAINFLDARRCCPKAVSGFSTRSLPRAISFCQYTVAGDDLLEIEDALADTRFASSPLVLSGPRLRFYAGVPVKDELGYSLGTLCIGDVRPRRLDDGDAQALRSLGRLTSFLVELRRRARSREHHRDLGAAVTAARRRAELAQATLELLEDPQPLETLLETAAQRLCPELGDCCIIDVRDGERQLRRCSCVPSLTAPPAAPVKGRLDGDNDALIARVLQTGTPLSLAGEGEPWRAALIVPLLTRGRVVGTLTLISLARPYAAADLSLALEVARRVAAAVAHATRVAAAEQAMRAQKEALAIVSHDLRNPLSTILTATGRLMQVVGDDVLITPSLERTQRAARRMMTLINDLLDAGSLDAEGVLTLQRRDHPLGRVLADAVDLLQPLADAREQLLIIELRDGDIDVFCDRERILQVLSNIVGNAIKFTPSRGRIQISASRSGVMARISVSDSGPGIAADALPHVFERYWHAETRELRPGAGLGLYIAKGIVERHGGQIWVETTFGRGATFHFTLPASASLRREQEAARAT